VAVVAVPALAQDAPSAEDVARKCEPAAMVAYADVAPTVTNKVQAQLSDMARQMRVRGVVRVEVCVAGDGAVIAAKPSGGHPMLVFEAVAAARQWRFKPRLEAGRAVVFRTVLEMVMPPGSAMAIYENAQKEENDDTRYLSAEARCRSSLGASQMDLAVRQCQEAVEMAGRLPADRRDERRQANGFLGQAYFGMQDFEKSLEAHERELALAQNSNKVASVELANAHHHVAMAQHALKETRDARGHYEQAEKILEEARDRTSLEELKRKYTEALRNLRTHYLTLLRQTKQWRRAAEVEKRLKADI
jgi:TonB family protein